MHGCFEFHLIIFLMILLKLNDTPDWLCTLLKFVFTFVIRVGFWITFHSQFTISYESSRSRGVGWDVGLIHCGMGIRDWFKFYLLDWNEEFLSAWECIILIIGLFNTCLFSGVIALFEMWGSNWNSCDYILCFLRVSQIRPESSFESSSKIKRQRLMFSLNVWQTGIADLVFQ